MTNTRKIEIFTAGCPVCNEAVEMIKRNACRDCEVSVLDMQNQVVADRAKDLGIRSVPAVLIEGKLADCCIGRGPDEATLKAAGLGFRLGFVSQK